MEWARKCPERIKRQGFKNSYKNGGQFRQLIILMGAPITIEEKE